MAKAAKDKSAGGGSGGALIGFVIVTLLAAGVGVGFGLFVYGSFASKQAGKSAAEAPKAEEKKPAMAANARLVELAPIVVNLAEPRDAWMRIEAAILVEGAPEGVEVLSRSISGDIAAYLKTATLAQFEGASGFQNLREDLADRARMRDSKHIKDLVIHGMVIE